MSAAAPEGVVASPQSSLFVLDACSLLNLVATRRFADIAGAMRVVLLIPEQTAVEVRYVRRGGRGVDAGEREPVDLRGFEAAGVLVITSLKAGSEIADFVSFASQMDDGEAASCAVAVNRAGTLVSDDRKARRIVTQAFPETPLLATSELIKAWANQAELDASALANVLTNIEERGNFRPGLGDPLKLWWDAVRRPI